MYICIFYKNGIFSLFNPRPSFHDNKSKLIFSFRKLSKKFIQKIFTRFVILLKVRTDEIAEISVLDHKALKLKLART